MVHYKLVYNKLRWLAEPVRLMFVYAGEEFEDVRLDWDEFHKAKLDYQFKKLPVLEVDGTVIPESYAISRYLARKYDLLGKDEIEMALVDAYADALKDFGQRVLPFVVVPSTTPQEEKDKLRKELFDPAAEKFLPIVRDIISKSKSCFLVDSGLTWADFFFTERLYTFEQLVPGVLKQYPMLSTYVEKVYGVSPAVKKHVEARPYTTI
ncbi:glutathione S-transferase-3 [Aphelenchoides avenae]|nr:glutathione S-transferase-3 [Aphelenchus avenae]